MISGDQMEHFLEESPNHESRLHGVFNKLSDFWQQQSTTTVTSEKTSADVIESILPDRKNMPISECGYRDDEPEDDGGASAALARRLEEELRAAKSAQLACGEVLLPATLLPRISRDVLRLAENEPCGLRGCTLFINFENDQENRRIGTVKCDPSTVSTFEVYLTLKQERPWHSLLPQFLKSLTRGGTVVISPGYTLEKKKLYRSYSEQ